MKVTLSWDEALIAEKIGEWRHIKARNDGLTRSTEARGKPSEEDDSEEALQKDKDAAGAEMAVAKATNCYWPPSLDAQPKTVPDVGKAIQVRHTRLPHGSLIVSPKDEDDQYFFLVTGEIPEYEVRGFLKGKDAKKEEWLRDPNGRPAAYFVPQKALREVKGT